MSKFFAAILIACASALVPASLGAKTPSAHKSAVPDAEDMDYASVSRTNPFEVVPAAGMELLEDVADGADAEMISDMISHAISGVANRQKDLTARDSPPMCSASSAMTSARHRQRSMAKVLKWRATKYRPATSSFSPGAIRAAAALGMWGLPLTTTPRQVKSPSSMQR